MQTEITLTGSTIQGAKETWNKPEINLIGIKEQTLGTHSLHGTDASFSS